MSYVDGRQNRLKDIVEEEEKTEEQQKEQPDDIDLTQNEHQRALKVAHISFVATVFTKK